MSVRLLLSAVLFGVVLALVAAGAESATGDTGENVVAVAGVPLFVAYIRRALDRSRGTL
jgi:hypothetical protein